MHPLALDAWCPASHTQSSGDWNTAPVPHPRTWTFDRYGKPACLYECAPGWISRCEGDTGAVVCTPSSLDTGKQENALVTRGGFNYFDSSGHLYPYFECNTGFYMHFMGTGDVERAPCDGAS